jgi:hypothetical protein
LTVIPVMQNKRRFLEKGVETVKWRWRKDQSVLYNQMRTQRKPVSISVGLGGARGRLPNTYTQKAKKLGSGLVADRSIPFGINLAESQIGDGHLE